eukprot:39105-Eustigmatos_ZCMA.PRE.1
MPTRQSARLSKKSPGAKSASRSGNRAPPSPPTGAKPPKTAKTKPTPKAKPNAPKAPSLRERLEAELATRSATPELTDEEEIAPDDDDPVVVSPYEALVNAPLPPGSVKRASKSSCGHTLAGHHCSHSLHGFSACHSGHTLLGHPLPSGSLQPHTLR